MADLPSGRRGQALALGLTACLLAVLWFGVAAPMLAWHAARQETLEQRSRLQRRMAELAASLPALRRQASTPGASSPAEALLPGDTDPVAAAALQQSVEAMARMAGAPISSIETLPAAPAGGLRRIGLHVTVTSDMPAVIHLLQAIGQARPRMLVDDLQMHSHVMLGAPQPMLDSGFVVYAFRSGQAGGKG